MADKNLVIIKSFKNGLRLIIDKDAPFSDVIAELSVKCTEGKNFFGNANTAISIEGRDISEDEEIEIIEAINNNCNLNVISIVGNEKTDSESAYFKSIELMQSRLTLSTCDNTCTFYRGDLKDGDSIETPNPVVILGNVNPGCTVTSGESIIVMGSVYGEAIINEKLLQNSDGNSNDEDLNDNTKNTDIITKYNKNDEQGKEINESERKVHFIFSFDLQPERIEINDLVYRPDSKSKWGHKHRFIPKIAFVKSKKIVVEDISKSVLESIYAL